MITKEQLKKQHDEIVASINTIDRDLDDIWEAARVADFDKLCRLSDHIRYYGRQSLGSTKQKIEFLLENLEEVLDENEQIKELPDLLFAKETLDTIGRAIDRWRDA